MIRKAGTQPKKRSRKIKWRGHEILRIEAFSDAVFAFAITLLVISLEVPKTFGELIIGMKGISSFAICFTLLLFIWHEQYIFFRMFYLKDTWTIVLNATLLFVVLCYVYPLKFVFSSMMEGNQAVEHGHVVDRISSYEQVKQIMIIYGAGFSLVYFVFLLLYINAWNHKEEIQLTPIERFYTKSELYKQLILVIIGLLTIVCALVLPIETTPNIGMLYFLIGPALFIFYSNRSKMLKKQFSSNDLAEHEDWLRS